MDTQTLRQVDEWLKELEDAANLRVGREFNPDSTTPQQTAHQAGQARGIQDARAWIQLQAKNHRPTE